MLDRIYRSKVAKSEEGMVLVIALVMLMLLTIIGVAAIDTSTMETMISGIEKERQGTFYAAEAGIEHGKAMLKSLFVSRNAATLAVGGTPDWDFALNGTETGVNAATALNYAGGAQWIDDAASGSKYTYDVKVWNNSDAGNTTNDSDGLLYLRSEATGPTGTIVSIEVLIQGSVSGGGSLSGYAAQAGAGSAKAYSNDDLNAISTFTTQL